MSALFVKYIFLRILLIYLPKFQKCLAMMSTTGMEVITKVTDMIEVMDEVADVTMATEEVEGAGEVAVTVKDTLQWKRRTQVYTSL